MSITFFNIVDSEARIDEGLLRILIVVQHEQTEFTLEPSVNRHRNIKAKVSSIYNIVFMWYFVL
jgi:hypothetical protein